MRQVLRWVALGVLAVSACAPAESAVVRRPNVLLISIDTLRADRLGCYGYERPTSPHIDALARESLVFTNVRATSSWTLPSMASLMTGLTPPAHGARGLDTPLDEALPVLAERLRAAGWRCAGFTSQDFVGRRYGFQRGFDWFWDDLAASGRAHQLFSTSAPQLTERAVAWLDSWSRSREEPFFLWIHHFDPHHAYLPRDGHSSMFGTTAESDLYDGEIAFVDEWIGRLLERLRVLGVDDETVILLVADHGEEFGEHGGTHHRRTLYDEVLRVPLLVRSPRLAPGRVDEPLDLSAVAPSLLAHLDLAPIGSGPVHSALARAGDARAGQSLAFAELVRERGPLRSIVRGTHKLIVDGDRAELYDLATDPGERRDLAVKRADLVDELRAELARHAVPARGTPSPLPLAPEDRAALRALGYVDER